MTGAELSFAMVAVTGVPVFSSASDSVTKSVSVPSARPERSRPVTCCWMTPTVPLPVTGAPPPELVIVKL